MFRLGIISTGCYVLDLRRLVEFAIWTLYYSHASQVLRELALRLLIQLSCCCK